MINYPVVEIFASIQGEGRYIGMPVMFIRFWGCNLKCTWCDTPGAVIKRHYNLMTADEIVKKIAKIQPMFVVLTGGEPMIQPLAEVLEMLSPTCTIDIETNGTIIPEESWRRHISRFVVSPKLKSSGMESKLNMNALKFFAALPLKTVEFKFVILDREDFDQARDLMTNLGWTQEVIMQAVDNNVDLARVIAEWIIQERHWNYRLLPQWHKYLKVR